MNKLFEDVIKQLHSTLEWPILTYQNREVHQNSGVTSNEYGTIILTGNIAYAYAISVVINSQL